MTDKELEWLNKCDSSNYAENVDWSEVTVYPTPDWVRHPERYPELMERMQELGTKWSELLRTEK